MFLTFPRRNPPRLLLLALLAVAGTSVEAQSAPTATQRAELSAFAGVSGTRTGFRGGRNLDITAGADLAFGAFRRLHPAIEIRGTYPLDRGQVDSQSNLLAGLRLERTFGPFRPYADLLFGRGEIDYARGVVNPSRTFYFTRSDSNVLSAGLGVDVAVTRRFAAKVDAQLQHYGSPVTASGHLYSKTGTLALVYRFDFNRRRR